MEKEWPEHAYTARAREEAGQGPIAYGEVTRFLSPGKGGLGQGPQEGQPGLASVPLLVPQIERETPSSLQRDWLRNVDRPADCGGKCPGLPLRLMAAYLPLGNSIL